MARSFYSGYQSASGGIGILPCRSIKKISKPKIMDMQAPGNRTALLQANLQLSASPDVHFESKTAAQQLPPENSSGTGSFTVFLDLAIAYAPLQQIMLQYFSGRRIQLTTGLLGTHLYVTNLSLNANHQGELSAEIDFTGSFTGKAFLHGKPGFAAGSNTVTLQALDYTLQTKNLLLKTARWLLQGKIEQALKKAASIPLNSYLSAAQAALQHKLNSKWINGISGSGTINALRVERLQAQPEQLCIRTACTGSLIIQVADIDLGFQH